MIWNIKNMNLVMGDEENSVENKLVEVRSINNKGKRLIEKRKVRIGNRKGERLKIMRKKIIDKRLWRMKIIEKVCIDKILKGGKFKKRCREGRWRMNKKEKELNMGKIGKWMYKWVRERGESVRIFIVKRIIEIIEIEKGKVSDDRERIFNRMMIIRENEIEKLDKRKIVLMNVNSWFMERDIDRIWIEGKIISEKKSKIW